MGRLRSYLELNGAKVGPLRLGGALLDSNQTRYSFLRASDL